MNRAISAVIVLFTFALIGCGNSPDSANTSGISPTHIQWFDGEVDAAFAEAKDEGKPIFLYWGAEWCPPCHNLKINIFTRPEFIEAIQRFVPVYLDGDTKRAQLWAEKYKIAGYPTVILFSPTGVELFRMPSDVTMDQYGTLLQAAISDFRPVHQILDEVVASGPRAASKLDLELVAYHSWAQDPHAKLSDAQALEVFWQLYSELPAESVQLRARFMTLALEQAMPKVWSAQPESEGSLATLDDKQMDSLRSGLVSLLSNPELWPENKIFLTLQSRRTIETLEPDSSPERDELVAAWLSAADAMQNHREFSDTEQLMAFVPEFELLEFQSDRDDDVIPPVLQEKVRARVPRTLAGSSDSGEFQSTLNMLVWLHTMAGLQDEAIALLDEHLDETAAPHYFLSLLGDLTADDPETALEWHRLAFEQSGQGSARVKWGSAYVLKLIQLAPEGADAIEAASRELIGEFVSSDDAFAGRNHSYLQPVDHALAAWAEATSNEVVIDRLRLEVRQQCDRFKAAMDTSQYERCMAFLSSDATSPEQTEWIIQ
jgi:thioredoxin-related protein